jgi:uncharacterized protein YuzE
MPRSVQVKIECSKRDGYLVVFARFRTGKVYTTFEIKPDLSADVDRQGRVLSVEIVRTFSTKAKQIKFEGTIDLKEVQTAVESHFKVNLDREFREIQEAGSSCFVSGKT